MVAYSATVQVPANSMTPISDGAVVGHRGVNIGGATVWLCASATATAPASIAGGIPYPPGSGWDLPDLIERHFSHLGVTAHLFAYCVDGSTSVSVSHA